MGTHTHHRRPTVRMEYVTVIGREILVKGATAVMVCHVASTYGIIVQVQG